MIEMRLRTRVSDAGMKNLAGKVLGQKDYDVLLTGNSRVLMPNGKPLCVYRPGAMKTYSQDEEVYNILHSIKATSQNRGLASGTRRVKRGEQALRTDSKPIISAVIGAVDPMGQQRYCRQTVWTGKNLPQWERLRPMLREVARNLEECVPERFAAQKAVADLTHPEWVVPGTPFSTVTVNQSYPTGVHTDKGDLDDGFSTLVCLRRGNYTGGQLVFPQYRVAVDMQDGDLLMMDAHQWHGNVVLICECGTRMDRPCRTCGANRVSCVNYYRTKLQSCGTESEEYAKAAAQAERRSGFSTPETEEPA